MPESLMGEAVKLRLGQLPLSLLPFTRYSL